MDKKSSNKNQHIFRAMTVIVVVILLAVLSSMIYVRIDLTEDNRYTLSETTHEVLDNLDGLAYVKVYLEGDMPVAFTRMQNAIIELLDEYKIISGGNLQYELINPHAEEDEEVKQELFSYLYDTGLQPVNVQATDDEGGSTQKLIFPGAILNYDGIELGLNLLKNNPGLAPEVNLNHSIQALEYEFTNAIRNLSSDTVEKIAFVEGHGELDQYQVGDITKELANFYQVDRGAINGIPGVLDEYKAVIIAKPQKAFSEADKFVLDQYIMNGGKVAWFIDAVDVNMDSLQKGRSLAMIHDLNLDDQLFMYGVRINPVLVKDIQSNVLPINTAVAGAPAKFTPAPWNYYPLLGPNPLHPVTTNLNLVSSKFANSIDTVGGNNDISKDILLSTSKFTQVVAIPALISLDEIQQNPKQEEYNQSFKTVAVMLEGKFHSVFRNRPVDQFLEQSAMPFTEESPETRLMVVADGDIIKNDVTYRQGGPVISTLGFDRYTRQTFGNKEFIMNAIHYLAGKKELIELRGKDYKLRILDKSKIKSKSSKIKWQIINVVIPIVLVIVIGILVNLRKRYTYGRIKH
jgi:ABC-2 type transport system permease protein